MTLTPSAIAEIVSVERIVGDESKPLRGFASLTEAHNTDLSFFSDPRYENHLYTTKAGAVLLPLDFQAKRPLPSYLTQIYVRRPDQAFYTLVQKYKAPPLPEWGREPNSFIHPSAEIPEDTYIGAFAYIGERVKIGSQARIFPFAYVGAEVEIGEGTVVYPHAVIMPRTKIGSWCIIHPGAVIGADGFGFYKGDTRLYERIPQIGRVVIEDEVEVGANTCVDRATLGETRLGKGVKLDNLIQIAHNVQIGPHTAIAAQTGIAGSTTIGAYCRLGGQVGIADHLSIAEGSSIAAQSGVSRSITTPGKSWRGAPAQEVRQQLLMEALMRRLPELYPKLREIEKIIRHP
ncbi:MAG: UDP-3-O-(3-hydroxymyristoyl)glucosamine N-acyltransferase [Bacteroidia bacterium]|nr:UDP-3-O-(3-hydroxymyristoyl)glucosamine N-acyltransferase [Bacteroidia bacterium]MCX7652278.1 UDP-3-O-(3-hydroxymyristoyl)glucosamine N-acyltransferase [Bacteroidia bacterium]MDW8416540.1 UDP-3-O-(3-hydroxymyristoyl)glucosamine N-acyltransferase [Bacteroidia bacterium]